MLREGDRNVFGEDARQLPLAQLPLNKEIRLQVLRRYPGGWSGGQRDIQEAGQKVREISRRLVRRSERYSGGWSGGQRDSQEAGQEVREISRRLVRRSGRYP